MKQERSGGGMMPGSVIECSSMNPKFSFQRLAGALLAGVLFGALMHAPASSMAADKSAQKSPGKPREGSLGDGKSEAALLTRNELRSCLAEQERLNTQRNEIAAQQRALDEEKVDITRSQQTLKDALVTLDRASQPAVDAYNARALELDQRIDAHNARNTPFNVRASDLQALRQRWERDCGNRRYDENDLIAIRSGR
jgi:hypothetical protein